MWLLSKYQSHLEPEEILKSNLDCQQSMREGTSRDAAVCLPIPRHLAPRAPACMAPHPTASALTTPTSLLHTKILNPILLIHYNYVSTSKLVRS